MAERILLAAVLAAALLSHPHEGGRRASSRGATTSRAPRFGGVRTAWALRARRGALPLGRWALGGFVATPLRLAARTPGAILVVGPTQSGKTTLLCAPLVEGWSGPVLAASVKGDLAARTAAARRRLGTVLVVAPGTAGSAAFDPVDLVDDWSSARGVARDLTVGTGAGGSVGDQEFWSALAAKLLAPMLLAARRAGGSIDEVKSWVDARDLDTPLGFLGTDAAAASALCASLGRDDRTLGSVLATLEAALDPLESDGTRVDPTRLVRGSDTCYLAAPLHDQRRYRPVFSGLLRQVLVAAADEAARGRRPNLLVLLDEAASIAPLEELDQVAATCQGQGVTLVTVWQDLAQLTARYGDKARTLLNNHSHRVLLGGLADPTLGEWLPVLTGAARPGDQQRSALLGAAELRQWPRGAALLVAGRHPPVRLVLRPPRH